MKIYIDLGNGKKIAPFLLENQSLDDVKLVADSLVEPTFQDIVIYEWEMPPKALARRQWIGHPATPEEQETNIIDFGILGFYDAWT